MEVRHMRNRYSLLFTVAVLAMGSAPLGAQVQDTGIQPIHFDAPANISVETGMADSITRTDRRSGRARGYQRLNQYRLRRSGTDGMGRTHGSTQFTNRHSGTLAFNPADPPRWAGPAAGNRYFQTRITVQHRRLFNPH